MMHFKASPLGLKGLARRCGVSDSVVHQLGTLVILTKVHGMESERMKQWVGYTLFQDCEPSHSYSVTLIKELFFQCMLLPLLSEDSFSSFHDA